MSEEITPKHIARFVSYKNALQYDLAPDRSTFSLNSTRYYREHGCEKPNDPFFDRRENEVDLHKSKKKHIVGGNENLVSCWSILKHPEIDWSVWKKVFPERPIAILSTVEKVRSLLEQHLDWLIQGSLLRSLELERVRYYEDTESCENLKGVDPERIPNPVFWKHQRYKNQEELRFALRLSVHQSSLRTVVFSIQPFQDSECSEYVDSIWADSDRAEDIGDINKLKVYAGLRKIPIHFSVRHEQCELRNGLVFA